MSVYARPSKVHKGRIDQFGTTSCSVSREADGRVPMSLTESCEMEASIDEAGGGRTPGVCVVCVSMFFLFR